MTVRGAAANRLGGLVDLPLLFSRRIARFPSLKSHLACIHLFFAGPAVADYRSVGRWMSSGKADCRIAAPLRTGVLDPASGDWTGSLPTLALSPYFQPFEPSRGRSKTADGRPIRWRGKHDGDGQGNGAPSLARSALSAVRRRPRPSAISKPPFIIPNPGNAASVCSIR